MPIHRRLPKRGFANIFKKKIEIINIKDLSRFKSGSTVNEVELVRKGLVKARRDGIKLLGNGEIDYPLTINIDQVSNGAKSKIEAAGGTVEVI